MTAEQWPALIVAIGGFLAVLGTGAKWLIGKVEQMFKGEQEAREELQERLELEIHDLKKKIETLSVEKAIFLRRIYQLENFIHGLPGIQIPDMKGWPPE